MPIIVDVPAAGGIEVYNAVYGQLRDSGVGVAVDRGSELVHIEICRGEDDHDDLSALLKQKLTVKKGDVLAKDFFNDRIKVFVERIQEYHAEHKENDRIFSPFLQDKIASAVIFAALHEVLEYSPEVIREGVGERFPSQGVPVNVALEHSLAEGFYTFSRNVGVINYSKMHSVMMPVRQREESERLSRDAGRIGRDMRNVEECVDKLSAVSLHKTTMYAERE